MDAQRAKGKLKPLPSEFAAVVSELLTESRKASRLKRSGTRYRAAGKTIYRIDLLTS
jgi:hypothetical protein